MNVLFLAPHPFYQDRGTPIAVNHVLQVLSSRGDHVDVVTYHEGKNVALANIHLFRTPSVPFLQGIRPGFSWQKIVCDCLMIAIVLRLAFRKKYHLVHAVEESVFMALLLKWIWGIPYVYDMDSSLPQQVIEKYAWLHIMAPMLSFFEGLAVRQAIGVLPVCKALEETIRPYKPKKVQILHDVSLLQDSQSVPFEDLRANIGTDALVMYVGNLEAYQGIDLLLEGFALAAAQDLAAQLVIIGGDTQSIQKYRQTCERLQIGPRVHFLGPRPIESLRMYLVQADVLVSPRIQGNNTPMKIYSYLDSGKALLATNLPTHTQVLTDEIAWLCEPHPESLAEGLLRLVPSADLRQELGRAGQRVMKTQFSPQAFQEKLNNFYDGLNRALDRLKPFEQHHQP